MRVMIDFSSIHKEVKPYEAEWVDTIPAHLTPDPDLLRRYFGYGVPKHYLSPMNTNRSIYRKNDGTYVLLVDNKGMKKYVREIEL